MNIDRTLPALPDRALAMGLPTPPTDFRKPMIAGLTVIAIAFGGFGTWAALAPLDSAVVSQGVVTVDSKRKTVQHREGGIVAQILVREGDSVAAGAVLARLDDAQAVSHLSNVRAQLDAKLAQQARLIAERDGLAAIAFPAELSSRRDNPTVAETIAREQERFAERRKTLEGQREILSSRIAQLESQRDGRSMLGQSKATQVKLLEEEIAGLKTLTDRGFYPVNRLREKERELARLQGDLYADGATTTQTEKEIAETRLQILQTDQKFRDEVVADLSKTDSEVNELATKLIAARDAVERLAVVAPVAGTVQNLKIAGKGAVVAPGGPLMELVPEEDRLVVETQISPRDVDKVRTGQTAELRFTSFNARTTPVVEGKLAVVAADSTTDEATRQSYYTARVEVEADQLARLNQPLRAGMPVEVMVKGGERTALQYLFKPLTDSMARALKEN